MKKKHIWKKTAFPVSLVVLAVLCFVVCTFLPEYLYMQKNGRIQFENPESFATSEDGRSVIVDDRKSLYCMDDSQKLIYALDVLQFPYEESEIMDAFFGAEGQVYCHLAIYDADSRLTSAESVWEISPNGEIDREVIHRDYQEEEYPPVHQVRIYGIHTVNDNICYFYKEDSRDSIVTVDPESLQEVGHLSFVREGFGKVVKCHAAPGHGFLVMKNNGEVGSVSYKGEYKSIYKADYNLRKDEGVLLYDVCMAGGKLYLLTGEGDSALYQWNGEWWERLLSVK